MKVTKINQNTMTVKVGEETAVITRRGPTAKFINCGSEEVQRLIWSHLDTMADQPGELFGVAESLDARLTRVADLQYMDNQRLNSIAESLDSIRGYAVNKEEVEDMIKEHIDEDQLHDAIATYVMAKPNVLRRAILDIITDKLC